MQYGFKMFPLSDKPWCQVWAREPDGLMVRGNQVCDHFPAGDRPWGLHMSGDGSESLHLRALLKSQVSNTTKLNKLNPMA